MNIELDTFNFLDILILILITIHFGVPLVYYYYMKKKWLNKPWNIKIDPNYKPKVVIIIPTYNEAKYIERKLNNIYQQEYLRDKLEIIVVDSASTDGTPQLVKRWKQSHPNIKLKLLEEPVRRGMNPALNYALNHVSDDAEVVIFTDADAFWETDTLRHVIKYFADPNVGAVTTNILPLKEKGRQDLELSYRNHYNLLRVAESKLHSTPIHNGALVAYRKKLLDRIGGIPLYTGNNDSTPASLIAFMGYRAIQIDDIIVREPMVKEQTIRKIRRAQHLVLHFLHTKNYAKKLGIYKETIFNKIWRIEAFLHIINPMFLLISLFLLIISGLTGSIISIITLILGFIALFLKPFRAWLITQLYLIIAAVRNLWTRELMWKK